MAETAAPTSGKVVQTTTTRRVIPAGNQSAPDLWETLEKLTPDEWSSHNYVLYVYRLEPGPSTQIEKLNAPTMVVYDQGGRAIEQLPINGREETDWALTRKWGGKNFRLLLKSGRAEQRLAAATTYINAPPKFPFLPREDMGQQSQNSGGVSVTPAGEYSATADVAKSAMNVVASQDREGIAIGASALQAAANVIKQLSENGGHHPAAPQDDLTRQFMLVMMQRAMVDPFESFAKMLTMMQTMNAATNPTGAPNPMMQKVLDVALDKVLNPGPTGPVSSAGAELVRQIPSVAGSITEGIREWRLGMEAQRDIIAAGRVQGPRPGQPAAPATAIPQTAPNPAALPAAAAVPMPSLEFIESKIVQILAEPCSADEAADKALEFLETADNPEAPQFVPQLSALGEIGLLNLFQMRPALRPATANLPRLQEFISVFLKYATASDAENTASASAITAPPKPN